MVKFSFENLHFVKSMAELLSDGVLCSARVLAAIFFLHIRNVHVTDNVVVHRDILANQKASAVRNLDE